MSPATKQPKTDAQRADELEQRAHGTTPFAALPEEVRDADSDANGIEEADAAFALVQRETADGVRNIRTNRRLSAAAREEDIVNLGLTLGGRVCSIAKLVGDFLAGRMRRARDVAGGSSEPVGTGEVVKRLARGTTTGFDDALGQLVFATIEATRSEILHLARATSSEELRGILTGASVSGDLATWASVDLLPAWLRNRVLAVALIDKSVDARLHRELRAALDPERAALMSSLVALGQHLVQNARLALSNIERATRPERAGSVHWAHLNAGVAEGAPRLEQRLDEALAALRSELRTAGEDPFFAT